MKKLAVIFIILFFSYNVSHAQFKKGDLSTVNKSTNNLILGIFNPKNFSMKHSFQVSMLNSQYGNISLTSYTNSMQYRFSDRLQVNADVTMQYSPYASSSFGKEYSSALQKDLTGLNLSRLSLDYKISDNSYLKVEYRNLNNGLYNYGYGSSFFDERYDSWK